MKPNIATICGIPINSGQYSQLLAEIVDLASTSKSSKLVFTPNPEFILKAEKDENFKKILQSADINIPDGFGLVFWSRLLGWGISGRVAGADMVKDLLAAGNKEGWRIGLIGLRGGEVKQAEEQVRRLSDRYPKTTFIDLTKSAERNPSHFEMILACQGMVRQEIWIWENKDRYQVGVMMGIGGSLDFLTGFARRAPVLLRKLGLEWFWRVVQKPKHFKRAFKAVFEFGWLVARKRLGR